MPTQQKQMATDLTRLDDIDTEEVSVVDRAANKRKFIVVKADGSIEMAVAKDETKAKDQSKDEAEKAAADKTKAEAKAKEEEASKKATADAKAKDDAEKAKGKGKASDDEEEDDNPFPPKGKAKKSEAIDQCLAMLAVAKSLPEDVETPAALIKSIEDGVAVLKGEQSEVSKADSEVIELASRVAKAGARMSGARFGKFKQGMELLMSVFGELVPADKAKAEDEEEDDNPFPPKGKGKAKAKKSDEPEDEVMKAVAQLTTAVTTLAESTAANASRVAKMETARGAGNGRSPEQVRKSESKDVSWPMDMTKPINRDTVSKETGFWG